MSRPVVFQSEPLALRNGVYAHASFKRRHRYLVMANRLVMPLVLLTALLLLVAGLLGSVWLVWTLGDALVRRLS